MKKVLKLAIAVVMMMGLFAGTTMAQTTIAYVEADVLIQDMAEYKKANIDLETYAKQLEAQLKQEREKFQKEYQAVVDSVDRGIITPLQQQQAQVRIQQKQQKLELQSRDAQNKIVTKEAELFKPINDKFNAALKAVAAEKNYTYIVDKKVLLYFEGGVDATEDVKMKLLQP
ncbi:MAG: OmpH family outer membrane protein [Saprospiraceae bacterium]|jgi:outer membrane protein